MSKEAIQTNYETFPDRMLDVVNEKGGFSVVAEELGCSAQAVRDWVNRVTVPQSRMAKKIVKQYGFIPPAVRHGGGKKPNQQITVPQSTPVSESESEPPLESSSNLYPDLKEKLCMMATAVVMYHDVDGYRPSRSVLAIAYQYAEDDDQ